MKGKEIALTRDQTDLLLDCAHVVSLITKNRELEKITCVLDLPEDYEIVHTLVKGGHSEVFVVKCLKTERIYALKKIEKTHILNDPLVNPIMNERASMILGRESEWLLGLHKSFQDENALYFLTDFISGGDLGSLCCRMGVLPEKTVRFFAGEILMALKELHSLEIIHRDIKPENILIQEDGHIKLADFGSVARLNGEDINVVVGTPDYVAPELLEMQGGKITEKIDVWSLGVVIYELVFGETPFYEETIKKTYSRIMKIDYKMGSCTEELADLIKKMLCAVENRLSVAEAMEHKFFSGFDFSSKNGNSVEYIPKITSKDSIDNFEVEAFIPAKSTSPKILDHLKSFLGFGYDPEIVLGGSTPASAYKEISIEKEQNEKNIQIDNISDSTPDKEYVAAAEDLKQHQKIEEKEGVKEAVKEEDANKGKETSTNANPEEEQRNPADTFIIEKTRCEESQEERQREKEEYMHRLEKIEKELDIAVKSICFLSLTPLENRIEEMKSQIEKSIKEMNKEIEKKEEESAYRAKKITRRLQTEIREAQSRIEREVELRATLMQKKNELAAENKELKEQIRRLKLGSSVRNFPMKIYIDNKWVVSMLYLEEDYIRIHNMKLPLNKIYFQNLKRNEAMRMNSKGEALSFKLLLPVEEDAYTEQTESSSDASFVPAEDVQLKQELEKETKILMGIEKVLQITKDTMARELALKQKTGTEKKIEEIRQALAQGSNGASFESGTVKYNNHTFKATTFNTSLQVWCHECNRPLYGLSKQGLVCKGCRIVCHRDCHTLVEYSCELQQAMDRGTSIILMAKHIEDKERIRALVSSDHS